MIGIFDFLRDLFFLPSDNTRAETRGRNGSVGAVGVVG